MVLKLIREIIRVGEATVPYPFVAVEVAEGFRGKPEHNPEKCIACGACAVACPSNALTMETELEHGVQTWSIFYGRCIYCARCEEVCPVGAIRLSQDFELAVMDKSDLYEHADYPLAECSRCKVFFAPAKEIAYALALLEHAGLSPESMANRRALMELCPACRRKMDLPRAIHLWQEAEYDHAQ